MKDQVRFQPKETTKWSYDTVALYRRYDNFTEADQDARCLRKRGWMIDSAYPHPYTTGYETHAVIRCS